MADVKAYEAINDRPRVFVAYGDSVPDVLIALGEILRKAGYVDRQLVALDYSEWDGEHSVTAVVTD